MSLNDTPRANRLHIGIFGKRNSGKSFLVNALTGQNISVVSDKPGTTTDPVYKSMELHPVGPVVFIDTAGFDDDEEELGTLRVEKTKEIMEKADVAVLVFNQEDFSQEKRWLQKLESEGVPVIAVISKADEIYGESTLAAAIRAELGVEPILVSALRGEGLDKVKSAIEKAVPEDFQRQKILGDMVKRGDL